MRDYSFACMTTASDDRLLATHLPFVFKAEEGPQGSLYGHISKQNPQVTCLEAGAEALVVFSGPHAYISADWYDVPKKRVPTWNYVSVQARGQAEILPQDQWMAELSLLVGKYEEDGAWQISKAEDYANRLLSGIVYFKIEIEDIVGHRKMSGNKSRSENLNVIRELKLRGEHATAAEMEAVMSEKEEK